MAITYTTAIQDRIAMKVWGQPNSALNPNQKSFLDGTWTTGDLAAGCAFDAITRINQYGQWFEQAGATTAPAAWEHWFVSLAALLVVSSQRPDRYPVCRTEEQDAMRAALASYTVSDITATTLGGQGFAVPDVRWYVVEACIRRERPLFISPQSVDAEIEWALNHLWNRTGWGFRKRQATITIAADGGVTNDLSGEAFDSIASMKLYYDDDHAGAEPLEWADADQMAAMLAASSATGRPRYFRTERKGSTVTWHFSPAPDQQYTARGELLVTGPGATADDAALTTAVGRFPPEYGPVIRDVVLARVLKKANAPDWRAAMDDAMAQVEDMLAVYESSGNPQQEQSIRDVYHDVYHQTGWHQLGGGM